MKKKPKIQFYCKSSVTTSIQYNNTLLLLITVKKNETYSLFTQYNNDIISIVYIHTSVVNCKNLEKNFGFVKLNCKKKKVKGRKNLLIAHMNGGLCFIDIENMKVNHIPSINFCGENLTSTFCQVENGKGLQIGIVSYYHGVSSLSICSFKY